MEQFSKENREAWQRDLLKCYQSTKDIEIEEDISKVIDSVRSL